MKPTYKIQKEALQKQRWRLKSLTFLAACQKDRLEYGWTLRVKYEDNELASDKDNVKRIEKAEKSVPAY